MKKQHFLTIILLCLGIVTTQAQYTVLHNFTGGTGGDEPHGDLSPSVTGDTLYGMALGGQYGYGCIFSVNKNGSGFHDIFDFDATAGENPNGSLTLSEGVLYGMTQTGGTNNFGTIFSINTNGRNHRTLINFTGCCTGSYIGNFPHGSLTISGGVLYGMTSEGGADGNIFSVDTNGSNFRDLVNFSGAGGSYIGHLPYGSLTISGGVLYGMTSIGGTDNDGNIFSVDTNGSNFRNLVNFTGSSGSYIGEAPYGSLTLVGGALYGMTHDGGTGGYGNIFSVDTNGSNFRNLVNFTGSSGSYIGEAPYGSLTLVGGALYGMTPIGGTENDGNIFSVDTNGSNFRNLVHFTGSSGSYIGEAPYGSLTLVGGALYGMTIDGGTGEGTIFSYTLPSATLSTLIDVSCNAAGNGSITLSVSAGTTPYTYSWSDGHTLSTATGLSAGTYSATVTDAVGVTVIVSATISQPAALGISISTISNVYCNTTSGAIIANAATGGTSPYTYSWAPTGGNNLMATGLGIGTYTLAVKDKNGCTSSATATITQPAALGITIATVTNVSCNGTKGNVTANAATGGTSPYTYSWSGGGGTNLSINKVAGNYTLTVSDNNGCSVTVSATITQPAALGISISTISNINCNNISGGITANAATGGTSPYTYSWSPTGGNSLMATGLGLGTYTLTVKDNNGCSATVSATISQPAVFGITMSSIMNVSCNGGTGSATANGTGGTSPYTYLWNDANSQTSAINSGLSAGTYSVTVQDGCGASATATAAITQPLSLAINISSVTNATCNTAGSVTANAATGGTSPYTYSWSGGGGNSLTAIGLAEGTYTLTAKDNNGCGATASVTISQSAALGITLSAVNNITCKVLGSITANAATGGTSPYTYSWSPTGGNSLIATSLSLGTYTLTVKDNNGCSATVSTAISQSPALGISISSITNVNCNGGTGSASANATGGTSPYTYSWSDGQTTSAVSGLGAGTFIVTVTDNYGCTATTSVTITSPNMLEASVTSITNATCNGGTGSVTVTVPSFTKTFSFEEAVQHFTAPAGISTVSLTINGAAGGGLDGGAGASFTGICMVIPGDILSIVTGGLPIDTGSGAGYGGGGASWVYDSNIVLYSPAGTAGLLGVAAGGGGQGVGGQNYNGSGAPGGIDLITNNTVEAGGTGGINGNGGKVTISVINGGVFYGEGSGGAGWLSNGDSAVNFTDNGTVYVEGGNDETNHFLSPDRGGDGGGYGGGGSGGYIAGSGGGGYNGGGGGFSDNLSYGSGGDGGGSYLNGVVVGIPVATNTGNGSVIISYTLGTSPYTYSWSPNGGTNQTATLSAGTYTLTVTDKHGCTATVSATITQPDLLGVNIVSQQNILCNGEIGSATAGATGGILPYTYSWSGGNGVNPTANLNAGAYTVTVTDKNGCNASVSATITQPASPFQITMASATNANCGGESGSAIANTAIGGTSPYTYNWYPSGGINLAATALSAGTYTIFAIDNNGCLVEAFATITQPTNLLTVSASVSANLLCTAGNNGSSNVSASGGTSPYNYSWSNGATTSSIASLTAGVYTVTVADANNCSATTSIAITQPNLLTASGSTTANISCTAGNNGSGNVSASGGTSPYNYLWSSGATTSSIASLTAGVYTVTVADANNCSSTTSITITQPNPLSVTALSANVLCNGGNNGSGSVSVSSGTSPYTYSWSNAVTTSSISGLSAGSYYVIVTDANSCSATSSISITQPANSLSASVSVSANVGCTGGNTGSGNVSVSDGTSPYTYSWSNSTTTSSIGSLSAGTYSVTVTDANNCSVNENLTITQPTAMSIATSITTNETCNGGATGKATVTASGGTSPYTYSWSPNGGSLSSATGLSAGTYIINVTNNSGCTATASVTITQPTAMSIETSITTNETCNGGATGKATVTASGGTSPFTYSWSPNGGSLSSATGLSAGTYTVHVISNSGCTATASVTITQPTAMSIIASVTTNESCNGGATGKASASVSGGTSPYTYSWSPNGGTTSSASGLSAGTYTVHVTSHPGCTATASVIITQPTAMSISTSVTNNESCNGGATGKATATASGGTSPYTYSWAPGGGSTTSASGLTAGTYTIHVISHAGCTATASLTITQPAAMNIATSITTNESCNGGATGKASASVSGGTSPYTYSWSPNGGSLCSATGLSAGIYTVHVTSHTGCTATASLTITQPTTMSIATSVTTNESCNGGATGKATATASGGTSPYTYSWSPRGETTSSASGLSAGTYTVHITSHSGCSVTATIHITQPAAIRDSISSSTCTNSKITATVGVKGGTSPYTYSWTPGGGAKVTATGLSAGTYTITIHDKNGCSSTLTAKLSCGNVDSPVKDTDNGSSNSCCMGDLGNVNLYPNPNTGQFIVTGLGKGKTIEVYDYTGRKISAISVSEETMQLNISNEANGLYLIRIIDKDGNLVSEKKMVKIQ